MARRTTQGGRIGSFDHDTMKDSLILGANIEMLEENSSSARQMEQNDVSLRAKRDYRNRIKKVYKFIEQQYPGYYTVSVRELSVEELADQDKWWHNNKHDLVYEGLNVNIVKAFLVSKKISPNGDTASFESLRKYNDAILFGAQKVKQTLSHEYYDEMEEFLTTLKKETARAARSRWIAKRGEWSHSSVMEIYGHYAE